MQSSLSATKMTEKTRGAQGKDGYPAVPTQPGTAAGSSATQLLCIYYTFLYGP